MLLARCRQSGVLSREAGEGDRRQPVEGAAATSDRLIGRSLLPAYNRQEWGGGLPMILLRILVIATFPVLASSCASTSFTQLARNQAVVSTSAAPVCHTSGAAEVARQGAAIATLNQGFERFIIIGYGAEDNTRIVSTGPTYATTSGSFNRLGNSVYGSSTTRFGGQSTFIAGRNDAQLHIVMLNRGDPGFDDGLDAKQALGTDWEKKVKDGVPTCF